MVEEESGSLLLLGRRVVFLDLARLLALLERDRCLARSHDTVLVVVHLDGARVDRDLGLHVVRFDGASIPHTHHPGGRCVGAREDAVGLSLADGGGSAAAVDADGHLRVGQAGIERDAEAHRRAIAFDHAVVSSPHRVGRHALVADVVELDHEIALQRPVVGGDGLDLGVLSLLPLNGFVVLLLLGCLGLTAEQAEDQEEQAEDLDVAVAAVHDHLLAFAALSWMLMLASCARMFAFAPSSRLGLLSWALSSAICAS